MDGGASSRDAGRGETSWWGLLGAAVFHYGRALANGPQARREVEAALAADASERVLDLGCGTGGFCRVTRGEYLGIDLSPSYVAFARWRWGSSRRRFAVLDLAALEASERFDGAIMVNCLHHLPDDAATAIFGQLARLVRRRLVVVDADPDASGWLQRFFLSHDRGEHVRPAVAQRRLLEPHFRVTAVRHFRNAPRTLVQVLFVCEPRT